MLKKLEKENSILFSRSILFTSGLFFLGVALFILFKEAKEFNSIPIYGFAMIAGFAIFGAILIAFGVIGSKKKMEKWANGVTTHEFGIVLIVLAYPIYFLSKKLSKK